MQNLTTLVKRLEAVTSRLEDIVETLNVYENAIGSSDPSLDLARRTGGSIRSALELLAPPSDLNDVREDLPRSIEEYDNFLDTSVGRYVKLSNELGGAVATQAHSVLLSFQAQRKVLVTASKTNKFDPSDFKLLLQPMEEAAKRVVEIQENSWGDISYNHLCCVADGIPLLGWVCIEMNSHRHVDKFLGYAQYFGNKVTQNSKDPRHREWVQSFYQIFRDLSILIQEFFPLGITWQDPSHKI